MDLSNPIKTTSSKLGLISFVSLLVVIVFYRITIGIDLSDEAYYATYLDNWLKVGLKHSPALVLHQTAEVLLFPFAYAYKFFVGSEQGLILFLRVLYLLLSLGSMLTLYSFLKPLQGRWIAALIFGFGFLFIPWSCPAPSYNTIGMFGVVAALSAFGKNILFLDKKIAKPYLTCFSAFCWTCAIIAYPSLLAAFGGFLCIAYIQLSQNRPFIRKYALICLIFLGCGLGLLCFIFGLDHLIQMLKFTDATLHVSHGIAGKLHRTVEQFSQNPSYFSLCVVSLILGIVISIYPNKQYVLLAACFWIGFAFVYLTFFSTSALFLPSHDLLLLLALFGIFIPLKAIMRPKTSFISIINVMFCSSFLAGLITAATATNGLFNFPIGGLLAACLSLGFFADREEDSEYFLIKIVPVALLILANIIMISIFYKFMYGEILNPLKTPSLRMKSGIFSGLRTNKEQALFINKVSQMLVQEKIKGKVLVLGPLPGLYLLTSLSSTALSTWNYSEAGAKAVAMIERFYGISNNQPNIILRYINFLEVPLTSYEQRLLDHYHLITEQSWEGRKLLVYCAN